MPVHRALSTRADNVGNDCLWDLRQGDADDNRATPYGRGWRGVLVSTALEFNFLTATLALFTLVGVQECARRRSAIGAARLNSRDPSRPWLEGHHLYHERSAHALRSNLRRRGPAHPRTPSHIEICSRSKLPSRLTRSSLNVQLGDIAPPAFTIPALPAAVDAAEITQLVQQIVRPTIQAMMQPLYRTAGD
jgi:hypothetical protein